ncbi:hypothetical protein Pst134EB_006007 [Puccinia striiformis f. sp. tritici]|nr:hypothetical protein Pst134EB_006007 [Puccinia striiformis f. sp. tritici]
MRKATKALQAGRKTIPEGSSKGRAIEAKEIPNEGKFRSVIKARGALVRILVLFPEFGGNSSEESNNLISLLKRICYTLKQCSIMKDKEGNRRQIGRPSVAALLPIAPGIDFFAPVFFVKALTSKKSKSRRAKPQQPKPKPSPNNKVTDGTSAEAVEIRAESSASNPTEDGPDSYFRVKAIDVATIEPKDKKLMQARGSRLFPPNKEDLVSNRRISSTRQDRPTTCLHRPAPEMVREMVRVFKENLSQRSKWFSKRGVIKRERKDKRAVKKQIKTEVAQQIAAIQAEADRILSENQQTSTPSDSTEPLTPKAEKKLKKQLQKEEKILKKSQKANTHKKGKNPEVVA